MVRILTIDSLMTQSTVCCHTSVKNIYKRSKKNMFDTGEPGFDRCVNMKMLNALSFIFGQQKLDDIFLSNYKIIDHLLMYPDKHNWAPSTFMGK